MFLIKLTTSFHVATNQEGILVEYVMRSFGIRLNKPDLITWIIGQ